MTTLKNQKICGKDYLNYFWLSPDFLRSSGCSGAGGVLTFGNIQINLVFLSLNRNFELRSNLLSLDNKNKNNFILYCSRLLVTLWHET